MISFHAKEHEYFNDKNEKYLSVSGLYHLVEPDIDWREKAKKKSKNLKKYDGIIISPTELLKKWENAKIKGSEAGTILHDIREQELINTQVPTFNNTTCKLVSCSSVGGIKYSLSTKKLENNTVYPELIIYNHDFRICGQSDKVIVTNNILNVYDYKTDKSIEKKGYSNEWVKAEKLKAPVFHLDSCNFNGYSLKMSMYMYLLWLDNQNLKIGDIILDHLQIERDEEGLPILHDGKPKVIKTEQIKVPYLKKEVKDILNWYKQGKLNNGK